MSKTPSVNIPDAERGTNLPDNMPPELVPVVEWWQKHGTNFLAGLCLAVIVVACGIFFYRGRVAKSQAASAALLENASAADLKDAAGQYAGTAAGDALQLKLAMACYREGDYAQALEIYGKLAKDSDPVGFIARMGVAQTLEARGDTAEAKAAYEKFAADDKDTPLAVEAGIGIARCLALAGDKEAALAKMDELAAAQKGTRYEPVIAARKVMIQRFDGLREAPGASAGDIFSGLLPGGDALLDTGTVTIPDAPAQESTAQEAPAQETPAEEAPAQEAPAQEAPAQEAPAPAPEAPAAGAAPAEAPAGETPAPAPEAPAAE